MTQDELQFLGIYLSNFYVPFSTELGKSVESDSLTEQKEQMIQALKSNLNFNEIVCTELVEYIMGLSRSNCYKLVYGFVSDLDDNPIETWDATYWDFVNLMLGYVDTSQYSYNSGNVLFRSISAFLYFTSNCVIQKGMGKVKVVDGNEWGSSSYNKEYVKFGYETSNGTFVPVCDAHLYVGTDCLDNESNESPKDFSFTSSQIAFFQCLLSVDTNMGYGLNFFDVYDSDVSASGEKMLEYLYTQIQATSSSFSGADAFSLSAYGNELYVDCFGNIFRSSAAHQTIIIPGCINPYTWVAVDASGDDIEIAKSNRPFMAVNGLGLSAASSGSLYSSIDMSDTIGGSSKVNFYKTYDLIRNRFYSERLKQWAGLGDGGEDLYYATEIGESKTYNRYDIVTGNIGTVVFRDLQCAEEDINFYGYKWNLMPGDSTKQWDGSTGALWWSDTSVAVKFLREVFIEGVNRGCRGLWFKWDTNAFAHDDTWWTTYSGERCITGCTLKNAESGTGNGTGDAFYGLDNSEAYCIDTMCYIDDLGAFGFESSNSDIAYDTIQFGKVFDDFSFGVNFGFLSSIANSQSSGLYGFGSIFSSSKRGAIRVCDISTQTAVSLYTTYAIAGLYDESSRETSIGKLGYRLNREGLPQISNNPILFSQSYADEQIKKDLLNMLYYLLKPDAVDYIRIAIKNKLQAILVGWHNDMVGTSGTGATLGTTYYRTNYGYVTTPDLSEIQWTSSLINVYNRFVPLLVVFMVLSMLASFVTGVMSLQKCALGVIVFSAFLLVPVNAINLVVSKSNALSYRLS